MSFDLIKLVRRKDVGTVAVKGVLVYCAELAQDDGTAIWASKATMADEIGCSRQTVISAIDSFVRRGLLTVTGSRHHCNGDTVVYRLETAAVESLKDTDSAVTRAKRVDQS